VLYWSSLPPSYLLNIMKHVSLTFSRKNVSFSFLFAIFLPFLCFIFIVFPLFFLLFYLPFLPLFYFCTFVFFSVFRVIWVSSLAYPNLFGTKRFGCCCTMSFHVVYCLCNTCHFSFNVFIIQ
jgi:hypothetical protein